MLEKTAMMSLLAEFHFLNPTAFFALLPLFFLSIKAYRQNTTSTTYWEKICDRELLPFLLENTANKNTRWTFWLANIFALIAITALAAPTWQRLPTPAFRNNAALVIALNLSQTMNAEDVKPSRLVLARYKISDLLSQRKDGQTALLVYSGTAFTVTPLTTDIETIRSQLEALTSDIMPSEGNNTVAAIDKSIDLLKQAGLPKGHILLVTDSVESSKSLPVAAKLTSYQLSILGVGTSDGAPIALPEGGFAKDEYGEIQVPKLNVSQLKELAKAGKGYYQSMTADDSDISQLLKIFDTPMNSATLADKTNLWLEQWDDKGAWLLFLIIPWAAWQFRKGAIYVALLFVLPFPQDSYALEWPDLWQTKDQQAQKAYQQKKYDQAAKTFNNAQWQAASTYKAGDLDKATTQFQNLQNNYNLGNALAKKGQLKEALAAYEQAVKENPYDEDAKFNKDIVKTELEKQQRQQNSSSQSQEKEKEKNEKSAENSSQSKDEKNTENKDSSDESKDQPEHKAGDNPPSKKETAQPEDKHQNHSQQANKDESKSSQKENNTKQQTQEVELTAEQQQANEQWLKRIPDDPASLLKKKFKYQYSQQQE
jgi:Ca-activated chloride channel family protein